jgi:hypothetical protein
MKTSVWLHSAFAFTALSVTGPAQNVIYQFTPGEYIQTLCSAEDINGDGIKDILTGQPNYTPGNNLDQAGRITLHSGSDGALIFAVDGEDSGNYFGSSISAFSDINSDGISDLLVGAYRYGTDNRGRVYMISGSDGSILWTVDGEFASDRLGGQGYGVSQTGDIDQDGISEVVIGATGADNPATGFENTGKAYVVSGATGSHIYSWYGDGEYDGFGSSVSGLGDLNGDGIEDIGVGASGDDNLFVNSGSARVFSGADGSILIFSMNGESEDAYYGNSMARSSDLNSDGIPDILIGAYNHDSSAHTSCGAVYAMSGADGSIVHRVEGYYQGHTLGRHVSPVGDVNGDGVDEFIASGNSAILFSGVNGQGLTNEITANGPCSGLDDVDGDGLFDYAITVNGYSINVYSGDPFLGEIYCQVNLNTNGSLAQIGATGSSSVSLNDLTLQVTGAVPNQFGIFYYGIGRTQEAFGYGWRCVGPPFRRLPVLQLDASGNGQHSFDNTPNPAIPESLKVYAGRTFNFQFWYRDPTAGGPAFNLSDAVEITFYP